jgi:hypothetical protein
VTLVTAMFCLAVAILVTRSRQEEKLQGKKKMMQKICNNPVAILLVNDFLSCTPHCLKKEEKIFESWKVLIISLRCDVFLWKERKLREEMISLTPDLLSARPLILLLLLPESQRVFFSTIFYI